MRTLSTQYRSPHYSPLCQNLQGRQIAVQAASGAVNIPGHVAEQKPGTCQYDAVVDQEQSYVTCNCLKGRSFLDSPSHAHDMSVKRALPCTAENVKIPKRRCCESHFGNVRLTKSPYVATLWLRLGSPPNFARLVERTVTFDNTYMDSTPCMPTKRELHTGRYNLLHRSWPFRNPRFPSPLH